MILDYFNLPHDKYLKFIGDRPGQVRCHVSSTEKSFKLLEWKTEIPFEEGLKNVIRWYIDHQDRWEKQETMQCLPIYTNGNVIEMH